jgi:indole-3-glycerol phosphate synthase
VLESLFAAAERDSAAREQSKSFDDLLKEVSQVPPSLNVYEHLAPEGRIKLIAEIKRASPSRGDLAEIADVANLSSGYEQSGADAISVLTERTGFKAAVSIPTLRKDFISNRYQLLEARRAGASFALLILAHLDKNKAKDLMLFAQQVGLGVLLEVHTEQEIEIAAQLGGQLIGINTRDLRTFKTDIGLFEKMASLVPANSIKVAESSVKSVEDVRRYREAGADVVLVGEALVTGDWKTLIQQFIQVA